MKINFEIEFNKLKYKNESRLDSSYGRILKSSAMVGGSSMINIAIGIARMKIMAVLLGPTGIGLLSLFSSISTLTQTLTGLGVNSSGVRQIAVAKGSGETKKIILTAFILRFISIILGLSGAVLLALFSKQISVLTFGSKEHSISVSILGIAVFFTIVGQGQSALLQGLQRISELVKANVIGSFLGTVMSITVVYFFRRQGITLSIIGLAVMTTVVSWLYSRKFASYPENISLISGITEIKALLKLGIAFMFSGLMTMGIAYIVRITILHRIGFEATGLYQSAWTLGGLYVSFILQAMGADFYPRLTAGISSDTISNRLVNEQTLVGILLATPGVLFSITFARFVLSMFYAPSFGPAVGVLRWICLGTMIQIISWPLGFVIVAKAKQSVFIGCEIIWAVVSWTLASFCIDKFGLQGAGIAFFLSYVFHGILVYVIVKKISGFQWSVENRLTALYSLISIGIVFCSSYIFVSTVSEILGMIIFLVSSFYSVKTIGYLIPLDRIPSQLRTFRSILSILKD